MIISPIIIDTSDIMSQYTSITPSQVNDMLDNIAKGLAASFAQQLELAAQRELKQTRKRYIQNIKVVDSGKLTGTVILDYSKDPIVKMLEEGSAAFDMKPFFMASPKVKIGKKGGKYLTIPFRWGTPGTTGESDNFAFTMPKEIYKVAKNLPLSIPVGSGVRSAGISLKELPQQFQNKQVRPAISDNKGNILFKAYQHKAPVHQGITKYNDGATGQNSYRSFRRVSENSDDEAFIHPGIEKYNLIQKTLAQFNTGAEMSPLLDSELSKLGLL